LEWIKAVDKIQKTTASSNFKTGLLDITNRAQSDPNYNNSEQYYREIEKLRSDSLKGFSSKVAEAEAAAEFNFESKVAQIQIENTYKKKMIDAGQTSSLKLIDLEINNPTEYSIENIQRELDGQVERGIFERRDALKILQNSEQKVKFNSFLRDFRTDPIQAEKTFNKNAYGMDIETSEKARSKLKELKQLYKENEANLYGDMGLRVATGQITEDEIDNAVALNKSNPNEGITEAHGKQLKLALYRDVTQRIGAKQFKKYREAIDFAFSDSTQDKIIGYQAILEAYQNGIDPDEAKFLKHVLDAKKDKDYAAKAAAGKKLIETLFGGRPKDMQKETQSLLAYAKRIANGTTPEVAAQQTAVNIVQMIHPATVADPTLVGVFTPSKGFKNIPKVKSESSAGRQESNS